MCGGKKLWGWIAQEKENIVVLKRGHDQELENMIRAGSIVGLIRYLETESFLVKHQLHHFTLWLSYTKPLNFKFLSYKMGRRIPTIES